ncbi:type II toxin-antitoxin system HicA family toxin [Alloacidobacterium dinghuense]|uniref:Type II toxin-antitoxin system HicA family toxin n=1 Tax=Alloacidobacterium dinghuense TaxID=2763107 RepID=A0A7G8BJU0_9BACT|nr:type II toxin-antitoxin system HicA family toxin [Alloacidobacterium dinghuense]QNI32810.1 type II toxin-antitoxin system HicA family toxin [Alloacidobacterium dinghuense]
MSVWPSTRAKIVLKALKKIGWAEVGQVGSHLKLSRPGYANYIWAFHDGEEIGPKMLTRIAKHTGLKAEDL